MNFYYDFKDIAISTEELSAKQLRENPKSRSARQGFRLITTRGEESLGRGFLFFMMKFIPYLQRH